MEKADFMERRRHKEKDVLSTCSLPRWLQWMELSWFEATIVYIVP